jgi:hypothetical protein
LFLSLSRLTIVVLPHSPAFLIFIFKLFVRPSHQELLGGAYTFSRPTPYARWLVEVEEKRVLLCWQRRKQNMVFLMGLAIGLLAGFALIVAFARCQNSRAAHRRQLVSADTLLPLNRSC